MAIRKFSASSLTSANSKSSKLWDQETSLGTYESIATATVDSGGASVITFNNIPSNYAHLQVRGIIRGNVQEVVRVSLNNDATATWSQHYFYSGGPGGLGVSGTATTGFYLTRTVGVSTGASTFTAFILDILDYSNTTKYKTAKNLYGWDVNGSGYVGLESAAWMNTAAVTRLDLTPNSFSFQQYSHVSLYGIRGA